jgi:hypothetical protein
VEHDEPPMDGVMTEGYGQRFGERLRDAPAMVTRKLCNADIAATEVRSDNSPLEVTGAFQGEDALDGRRAPACTFRASEICLHDQKRGPSSPPRQALLHSVFYLPHVVLDATAGAKRSARPSTIPQLPASGA